MKNCIIAQSGGPTVAINASLAGILEECCSQGAYEHIYGSLHGITGILNDEIIDLSEKIRTEDDFLEKLKITPAMYLGSCRYKMPDRTQDPKPYEKIFSFFEKYNIGGFYYIGGNDSMDTVLQLSQYAKDFHIPVTIMGVPKTIDNDLCLTDHTPGFGSAAKYIAATMREIAYDTAIYPIPSVTLVEIMGRDAGWLTAAASLSRTEDGLGPDYIYLPEFAFDTDAFMEDVKQRLTQKNNVLIALSEGIRDKEGNYISASGSAVDSFGHTQLSGAGKTLEYLIKEKLGIKVRSIEINLPQRCAAHLSSDTDLRESAKLGQKAVRAALNGCSGQMAILRRLSDTPYQVCYETADIQQIANKVKSVPTSFITPSGNDVTPEMLTYLRPLICGESVIPFHDGLPMYASMKHLL